MRTPTTCLTALSPSFVLVASTLAVFAPNSVAQGRVWPAPYATTPGESSMDTPFTIPGYDPSNGSRCATMIEGATLPFNSGTMLDGIAFRRDSIHSTAYSSANGRVTMRIGSIVDAMKPKAALREMWLGEPLQVASAALSLPSESPPGAGPAAFSVAIPFDIPWTYPGGDMGFDLAFTGPRGTLWRRDAVYRTPQTDGQAWIVGPGCAASHTFIPQPWIDAGEAVPGGSLGIRLQGVPLPVGGLAYLSIGWPRGIGIPLDPIGMPAGCRTHIDGWDAIPALGRAPSRKYAEAAVSFTIPTSPAMSGAGLGFEWLIPDPAIGAALPFVVSDAMFFRIGATAATLDNYGRSVWAYGTTTVGYDYTGRLAEEDYVPVTEFRGTFR